MSFIIPLTIGMVIVSIIAICVLVIAIRQDNLWNYNYCILNHIFYHRCWRRQFPPGHQVEFEEHATPSATVFRTVDHTALLIGSPPPLDDVPIAISDTHDEDNCEDQIVL